MNMLARELQGNLRATGADLRVAGLLPWSGRACAAEQNCRDASLLVRMT
jgi:hypothetical protein